jgi:hypothetical protein
MVIAATECLVLNSFLLANVTIRIYRRRKAHRYGSLSHVRHNGHCKRVIEVLVSCEADKMYTDALV